MSEHERTTSEDDTFRHCALIHQGCEQYLRGVLNLVDSGLAQGSPVILAVPPERVDLIAARLNGQRSAVEFADMRELGRNPAWIIPAIQRARRMNDEGRAVLLEFITCDEPHYSHRRGL